MRLQKAVRVTGNFWSIRNRSATATFPSPAQPCRRGSECWSPDPCGGGGRRRGREASAPVQRCVVPGACIQLIRYAKTLGWLPWPPGSNSSSNSSPSAHPALIASLSAVCLCLLLSDARFRLSHHRIAPSKTPIITSDHSSVFIFGLSVYLPHCWFRKQADPRTVNSRVEF